MKATEKELTRVEKSLQERDSSGRRRKAMISWAPEHLVPVAVRKPELDPALPTLPFHHRGAECLRYLVLSVEHTVSPGGVLRSILKVIVALFVVSSVAGLAGAGGFYLVTLFLRQVSIALNVLLGVMGKVAIATSLALTAYYCFKLVVLRRS